MTYQSNRLSRTALAACVALGLAGCAGGSSMFGLEPGTQSAEPAALAATTAGRVMIPTQTATSFDCPMTEVRPGTEVLRFAPSGMEAVPTQLRWQANLNSTERECIDNGGAVTVRLGIDGQLLLGPQGTPGTYRLPVRIAVIRGESTVLSSRVVALNVTVPAGQGSVVFAHVEEGISIPRAQGDRLTDVSIAVGFDPVQQRPERRRPARS